MPLIIPELNSGLQPNLSFRQSLRILAGALTSKNLPKRFASAMDWNCFGLISDFFESFRIISLQSQSQIVVDLDIQVSILINTSRVIQASQYGLPIRPQTEVKVRGATTFS